MTDLLTTLGSLVAALGNVKSADVLRERLALALQQAQVLEADAHRMRQQIGELLQQQGQLRLRAEAAEQQLAQYRAPPAEVQHRGVNWRRTGGRYLPDPYCPRCALALVEFAGRAVCPGCPFEAPFAHHQIAQVMKGLPE